MKQFPAWSQPGKYCVSHVQFVSGTTRGVRLHPFVLLDHVQRCALASLGRAALHCASVLNAGQSAVFSGVLKHELSAHVQYDLKKPFSQSDFNLTPEHAVSPQVPLWKVPL